MHVRSEYIRFDLTFTPKFWDRAPRIQVCVDDQIQAEQDIIQATTISFFTNLEFDRSHQLIVHRSGKSDDQCQGGLDQILILDRVMIDSIDIKNIVQSRGRYMPCYPEPWASQQLAQGHRLDPCVTGESWWGHNGVWILEFTSPFYQYLITCMN